MAKGRNINERRTPGTGRTSVNTVSEARGIALPSGAGDAEYQEVDNLEEINATLSDISRQIAVNGGLSALDEASLYNTLVDALSDSLNATAKDIAVKALSGASIVENGKLTKAFQDYMDIIVNHLTSLVAVLYGNSSVGLDTKFGELTSGLGGAVNQTATSYLASIYDALTHSTSNVSIPVGITTTTLDKDTINTLSDILTDTGNEINPFANITSILDTVNDIFEKGQVFQKTLLDRINNIFDYINPSSKDSISKAIIQALSTSTNQESSMQTNGVDSMLSVLNTISSKIDSVIEQIVSGRTNTRDASRNNVNREEKDIKITVSGLDKESLSYLSSITNFKPQAFSLEAIQVENLVNYLKALSTVMKELPDTSKINTDTIAKFSQTLSLVTTLSNAAEIIAKNSDNFIEASLFRGTVEKFTTTMVEIANKINEIKVDNAQTNIASIKGFTESLVDLVNLYIYNSKPIISAGIFSGVYSSSLKSVIRSISGIAEYMVTEDEDNSAPIDSIIGVKDKLEDFNDFLTELSSTAQLVDDFSVVVKGIRTFRGINILKRNIESINDIALVINPTGIDSKNIESEATIVGNLSDLVGKMGVLGALIPAINKIPKLTESLKTAISSITEIPCDKDTLDKIKLTTEAVDGIAKLGWSLSVIGLLAVPLSIAPIGLGVLTLNLAIIKGIVSLLGDKKTNVEIQIGLETSKALGQLLISSATAMLLVLPAALLANPVTIAEFTLSLSLLVGGVLLAYGLAAKISGGNLKEFTEESVNPLLNIILVSSLILSTAGMLMMIPGISNRILEFAAILGVFIAGVTVAYGYANKLMGLATEKRLARFEALIETSALLLMLGAGLMFIPGFGANAIAFAGLLSGFIAIVTLAYAGITRLMKDSVDNALGLGVLVGTSVMTLMIGALFMESGKIVPAFLFALGVGAFTVALLGALAMFNGRTAGVAIKNVWALSLLVTVISGTLLLASMVASHQQNFAPNVLAFTLGLSILVVGITASLFVLKFIKPDDIAKMFVISAVVAAMGLVSVGITYLMGMAGGPGAFIASISTFSLGLMILTLGIAGAGLMTLIPTFWFGILGLIATGITLVTLAKTLKDITAITGDGSIDTTGAESVVDAFARIAKKFTDVKLGFGAGFKMNKILLESIAMYNAIHFISKGIKEMANLTISEYDMNGKVVGAHNMTTSDFQKAGDTVSMVIGTLGKAIVSVYDENPDMFKRASVSIASILTGGGRTPFEMVVKGATNMGKMISKIAYGVKDFADMRVPIAWDKNGKAIDWRRLSKSDFDAASANIKSVIETLGGALITTFDAHKDWFEPASNTISYIINGGGRTPFEMVVKGSTNMGKMISKIARSVKDFASLMIPTKWDKEGNAIEWKKLGDNDFSAAGKNVSAVISTIGNALIETFSTHRDWFEPSSKSLMYMINGSGKTPFDMVMRGSINMGKMISSIANGIQAYASMSIPTEWDNNGTPIKFKSLSEADLTIAYKNIASIITNIGSSLVDTYEKNPKLFKSDAFTNMTEGFNMMGDFLNKVAQNIVFYATMTFPKYDKDGVIIGNTTLDDTALENAKKHVKDIITILGESLMDTFGEHPDWFEDKSWFSKKPENTKFGMLIRSLSGMGALIGDAADIARDLANFTYTDATGNKQTIDTAIFNTIKENVNQLFESLFAPLYDLLDDKAGKNTWKELLTDKNKQKTAIASLDRASKMFTSLLGISGAVKSIVDNISDESYNNKLELLVATDTGALPITIKNLYELFNTYDSDKLTILVDGLKSSQKVLGEMKSVVRKINKLDDILTKSKISDATVANIIKSTKYVSKIFAGLDTMIGDTTEQEFANIKTKLTELNSVIKSYNKIINNILKLSKLTIFNASPNFGLSMVNKLFGVIDTISSKLSDREGIRETIGSMIEIVNDYALLVNNMVDVNTMIVNSNIDTLMKSYDTVTELLNKIDETAAKADGNAQLKPFSRQIESTKEFIQSVNSIDMAKADKITSLTQSFSELSTKMNNFDMDKFAEIINGELASALITLSAKLDAAQKTFDKADEVQKKRSELIKSMTRDLKDAIAKPMSVTVASKKSDSIMETGGFEGENMSSAATVSATPSSTSTHNNGNNLENIIRQAIDRADFNNRLSGNNPWTK